MRREHYVKTQTQVLPDGYIQLEYIQGKGTQYINTGINGISNTTEITIDFQMTNKGSYSPYGAHNNNTQWILTYTNSSSEITHYLGSSNAMLPKSITVNQRYIHVLNIDFTNSTISIDINNGWYRASSTFNGNITNNNIGIFAACGSGSDIRYHAKMNLYAFSIVKDSILVRNFIPALRISDNKPGLYDFCGSICSQTGTPFYINVGTGEFLYA